MVEVTGDRPYRRTGVTTTKPMLTRFALGATTLLAIMRLLAAAQKWLR